MLRVHGPVAAVVSLAMLVLGACGDGGAEDSAEPAAAPAKSDRTAPLAYSLVADGDLDLSVGARVPVRVLTIEAEDEKFAGVTLLSVGPAAPVDAGSGAKVRAAFDLTRYRGEGSYRIRAGSPRDLLKVAEGGATNAPPPDQSNVLFQYWPSGDVSAPPEVFDTALEPCELTVKDDGRAGRLRCPAITNEGGKRFSLDMRWGKQ